MVAQNGTDGTHDNTTKTKAKLIPIRFRERTLIDLDSEATAEYSLAAPLQLDYRLLWPATGPP